LTSDRPERTIKPTEIVVDANLGFLWLLLLV